MIEVGEYVRNEDGCIWQIKKHKDLDNIFINEEGKIKEIIGETVFGDDIVADIVKHSQDIIDLIEVGDYVNGYQVRGKTNNKVVVNYYMYSEELSSGFWLTFYEDGIKDIVTREQFESMKYKVEDN